MTRSHARPLSWEIRLLIAAVVGVLLPAGLLHGTTTEERLTAGLTLSPFTWPRLLIVHLACALPLAIWIGYQTQGLFRQASHKWAVAFVALLIAIGFTHWLGSEVTAAPLGSTPSHVLRVGLATLLTVPVGVLVWPNSGARDSTELVSSGTPRPGVWFAVCAGFALVPPGLYASAAEEARYRNAETMLETSRLKKALILLDGLAELGSERRFGKLSLEQIRKQTRDEVKQLEKQAERSLPVSATPGERFARSEVLIQLDRLDEAAALLRPLTEQSLVATMNLAAVERDRADYTASDEAYRRALEKIQTIDHDHPEAAAYERLAYEGLAYNAHADRRPRDAEAVLKQALANARPSDAAQFHFLLGNHYRDGGRPARAIEHYEQAAQRNPKQFAESSQEQIRQLRTMTPACFR